MTDKKEKGSLGEKAVVKYLKKNKYKIIETNYAQKAGEIDIIAENKEYIIFVEVKTRAPGQMLPPGFSVDYKKRRRILITASFYIRENKVKKQPRFDIAEVIMNYKGKPEINYIDNAFGQEGDYGAF